MPGTALPRASAPRSRQSGPASTRCGRRWAGWTGRTATGTWCACARPWRRMRSPLTEELVWTLLVDASGRPGADNMARDAALLEEADRTGQAFLRLYRFNPPQRERSEEHTSELQSLAYLVCRLLL